MSIDLSQFIGTFLEESYEGLEVMESSLLDLDSADEETINTIFRAAHSIKGGAGTFGFSDVADFTHVVETVLDEVRSGQQQITPELVNLLLKSVDCIKALLEAAQDGPEADSQQIASVQQQLEAALGGKGVSSGEVEPAVTQIDTVADSADLTEQKLVSEATNKSWTIKFKPHSDLLSSGHEPGLMFEALADLGELKVTSEIGALPSLAELDPEEIHISWFIELTSAYPRNEIAEIFEWVEDECDLSIEENTQAVQQVITPSVIATNDWQIDFIPDHGLLLTGNEPSLMFEALQELGDLQVEADLSHLPEFGSDDYDPEQVYLSWHLQLNSGCNRDEITEIFEWVEDECKLVISAADDETPEAKTPGPEVSTSTEQVSVGISPSPVESPVTNAAPPVTTEQHSVTNKPVPPAKPAATPKKSKAVAEASSIRVDTDKIDALINRVGELVITQAMLGQVGSELAELAAMGSAEIERLQAGLEQLERNTRDLQEDVMRVRMLPISFVFNRFPRLVHDVSGKLGKKVELIISGEQTEIDKTVMEKIGDPMVHLIRNSLDHGLEAPEERIAAGKPETGRVELNAYHQGGFIVIDIIDDGRGLDTEKIYQKALQQGLITAEQQLSDQEINELIFKAGFSTADAVSDLSGRGVGMDVVRRNIESLGGHVSVTSEAGYGSKFSVSLPLTLAILDGQLVRTSAETYIIPLVAIVETIQADNSAISAVGGENKLLHFRDEYIPLIDLKKLFKVEEDSQQEETNLNLIAIVESAGQKAGLVVDELYGQQQVVIKSLEVNFKRIEGFAGATILGDGGVALILDIGGIMKRGLDYETAKAVQKRNQIFQQGRSMELMHDSF